MSSRSALPSSLRRAACVARACVLVALSTVPVSRAIAVVSSPAWAAVSDQRNSAFGTWVSTAGDVNGDGFSDVVVGAPNYDAGQLDEGRVYVYHGSAGGLVQTPSRILETNRAGDLFGYRVGAAGDVNADGYDDVIVGLTGYTGTLANEGRVELYLGSPDGISTSPAWSFDGTQTGSLLGESVCTAGDVNGDGYDDVIVGGSNYGVGGTAFLFLGQAAGLDVSPVWTAASAQAGSAFGREVATAGDVNADGFDDVIVGAPRFDNGQVDEGRAFVYLGEPSGVATTPAWTAEPNQSQAHFGGAVCTAGDTNGDGYADVVVGAAKYDLLQQNEGRAFVYLGSPAGVQPSPSWAVSPNQQEARFGTAVGTAGDVNGDGYSDVVVGAFGYDHGQTDEGGAFLYLGSPVGLDVAPALVGESDQASAALGSSVMTAGDVNGDGFSEVMAGAPEFNRNGLACVYQGVGASVSPVASSSALGPATPSDYGASVASAGDLNGDGFGDLVVGAPAYANGELDEGAAFVFYASAGAVLPGPLLESNHALARLGSSVACAGDVNGDGYDDLIAGAPEYSNGETSEGRAYVYHGSPSGVDTAPAWAIEGNEAGARLGWSVAGAGDVNGDGYADVLVGAYRSSNGEAEEGRTFLYLGGSSGLAAMPAWSAEPDQAGAHFGSAVSGAGDVNGDGYTDVVIGADGYTNGEDHEGRAFLYLGSPSGLDAAPAWTAEANQANASFGVSVASAGDVNGDGYSDVLVGADGYDGGEEDEGRVFAYLGLSSGLGAVAAWAVEPNAMGWRLGSSVSSAGDVDDDGFSDIVIGAPSASMGQANEGLAFVYRGSSNGLAPSPATVLEHNGTGARCGSSVASASDVNGDGFADVVLGAPAYDVEGLAQGASFVHLGNKDPLSTALALNAGLDRIARQAQPDGEALIALLGGSSYPGAFRLHARGRTAAGRSHVWLEWEVKPRDQAFTGTGLQRSATATDTGTPAGMLGSTAPLEELVDGLLGAAGYRWRARILSDSPYFPRTPWLSMVRNASTELDLRTAPPVAVDVASPSTTFARGRFLEPVHPQPFTAARDLAFSLPEAADVHLAVYDAHGRQRVLLDGGARAAGRHVVRWDGRDGGGTRLAAGVYFIRLRAGAHEETQKVVWAP